jgi:hypothetical protein
VFSLLLIVLGILPSSCVNVFNALLPPILVILLDLLFLPYYFFFFRAINSNDGDNSPYMAVIWKLFYDSCGALGLVLT